MAEELRRIRAIEVETIRSGKYIKSFEQSKLSSAKPKRRPKKKGKRKRKGRSTPMDSTQPMQDDNPASDEAEPLSKRPRLEDENNVVPARATTMPATARSNESRTVPKPTGLLSTQPMLTAVPPSTDTSILATLSASRSDPTSLLSPIWRQLVQRRHERLVAARYKAVRDQVASYEGLGERLDRSFKNMEGEPGELGDLVMAYELIQYRYPHLPDFARFHELSKGCRDDWQNIQFFASSGGRTSLLIEHTDSTRDQDKVQPSSVEASSLGTQPQVSEPATIARETMVNQDQDEYPSHIQASSGIEEHTSVPKDSQSSCAIKDAPDWAQGGSSAHKVARKILANPTKTFPPGEGCESCQRRSRICVVGEYSSCASCTAMSKTRDYCRHLKKQKSRGRGSSKQLPNSSVAESTEQRSRKESTKLGVPSESGRHSSSPLEAISLRPQTRSLTKQA